MVLGAIQEHFMMQLKHKCLEKALIQSESSINNKQQIGSI